MADNGAFTISMHQLDGPEQSTEATVTPSTGNDHSVWANRFMKSYAVYFNIFTFAIIGCLIRIGLEKLLGPDILDVEDSATIIFESFFSNMVGSFILGIFAGSTLKGMPGMLPVYTGISTGLCGSITTYSKFNQQVSLMLIEETKLDGSNDGSNQFIAFASILLGLVAPLGSFIFGRDISQEIRKVMESRGTDFRGAQSYKTAKIISYTCLLLFVPSWITLLVIAIVYSGTYQVIFICASAALAPLGAIVRYLLGELNKKPPINLPSVFLKSFPIGTFLANFIGSVVIALVHVVLTWADLNCAWTAVFKAIQTGFCACLTTVSTFVSEIHGMRSNHDILASHTYPFLTIVISEIFACIINGVSYSVYLSEGSPTHMNVTCG